jgi:hypothetical protein
MSEYNIEIDQSCNNLGSYLPRDISFMIGNQELPIIQITEDGKFILSGYESEDPHEIVAAFRKWMKDYSKR